MKQGSHRRLRVAALVGAALVCVLGGPAAAPASDGVLWQGATPEQRTAYGAGVGRELAIPLEAAGPIGSSPQITADPVPRGGRIERISDAPARAVFRWKPTATQLGEWTLRFDAVAGQATAPSLTVYIHVDRKAARSFRMSSIAGRSQSATLMRRIAVRARPTDASPAIFRLSTTTPERVPHVLYLLSGKINADGRYWLRVSLPALPNGRSGWIPRDAVRGFQWVDTHLVIDRARFRATLYRLGRPIFQSIVGVGQPRWPTPSGTFYVRERLTGFTDPIYGALAFGTNARSAVLTDWPGGGFIGIHGTNQPEILPGRVSHGCVRMPDSSIRRLDRLMRVGTPVTIR